MPNKPFIVVCAWYKDNKKGIFKVKQPDDSFVTEKIADIDDYQVSDSICPECFAKELENIIAQKGSGIEKMERRLRIVEAQS